MGAMRLPESQIKQAILHPENEVSYDALKYSTQSFSLDPAITPLVIQASFGANRMPKRYKLITVLSKRKAYSATS
jgi:hypothetical protein